jgi:hypothetical protein
VVVADRKLGEEHVGDVIDQRVRRRTQLPRAVVVEPVSGSARRPVGVTPESFRRCDGWGTRFHARR